MAWSLLKLKMPTYISDEKGVLSTLTGILAPTIVLTAFVAVDYSNMNRKETQLQASLDAASLATSVEVEKIDLSLPEDEQDRQLKAYALDFFNANFGNFSGNDQELVKDEDFDLDFDRSAQTIKVTVSYEYDSILIGSIIQQAVDMNVAAETKVDIVPDYYVIDLVMCIDATASMEDTIEAAKTNARTLADDLRKELDSSTDFVKIRAKPIFFRDWEQHIVYHKNPGNFWWRYAYYSIPRRTRDFLEDQLTKLGPLYEGGLVESEFIDLDPSIQSGLDSKSQSQALEDFIASETTVGGFTLPEASGACLNEAIRSDWYNVESDETRDYFGIETNVEIVPNEEAPSGVGDFVRVKNIPVIAFWTDDAFNNLNWTRAFMSPDQPTSYPTFEALWNNANVINQERKILVEFGPRSGDGWNQVKLWDGFHYGGSLEVGNDRAVEKIAKAIKQTVPDVVRVSQ